jgi:hypothetical protein
MAGASTPIVGGLKRVSRKDTAIHALRVVGRLVMEMEVLLPLVASTEQADGTQIAKQIIIFPAELSGAAEGSVLTDPPGATSHSRMTNGSVSRPAASHSRMTNGTAQKGSGSTLVVRYHGGAQTISVPANVPVTEVTPEQVALGAGDTVYLTTDKLPNGTLTANKIFVIAPAVSPNNKQ